MKPIIAISNDDGYYAEGLRCLREALAPLGRVITIAPSQDCSGVSHKITIHSMLRLRQVEQDAYAVSGTPVDCIHIGLNGVLDGVKPDLWVSGINHGPNLGEDTAYSGTVAAAYEASVNGIPSIAISAGRGRDDQFAFGHAQKMVHQLAKAHLDGDPFLSKAVWNINVPAVKEPAGIRVVKLDKRSFKSSVVKRMDPRGVPYYWLGPYHPKFDNQADTDYASFRMGYISMTPLTIEMTHHEVLNKYPDAQKPFDDLFQAAW